MDLSLTKGETTALVAPSGAGKSTLLHIAGLLDTADQGQVILGGHSVSDANDRKRTKLRRQDIGFVYQFHHLLPEFSAIENIILPQLAMAHRRYSRQITGPRLLEHGWVDQTRRTPSIAILGW